MTELGLIGDTHANADALSAVLATLADVGISAIWSTGDIVGYNAQAVETIELHVEDRIESVQGNHDRLAAFADQTNGSNTSELARLTLDLTRRMLSRDHIEWLASLPVVVRRKWQADEAMVVHGRPEDPLWGRLLRSDADSYLPPPGIRLLVSGATHRPHLIDRLDATLVNPGSVGLPRDGDPRSSFATVRDYTRVVHHRVFYDPSRVAASNQEAGIPPAVNDYLVFGGPTPSHVRISPGVHPALESAAEVLSKNGVDSLATPAGMFAGVDRGSDRPLVVVAVLEDETLLIRTTPLPSSGGGASDGSAAYSVVHERDLRWLEKWIPIPTSSAAAEEIAFWCRSLDMAHTTMSEEGTK